MELMERFDNKRLSLNKVADRYERIPGEYSQAVHLWIMNDKGEFLLQKRSMRKRAYPGKWSVTGGAVDAGERSIDGLYRECKEELGVDLNPNKVELMMTLKRKDVFIDVYLDNENFDLKNLKLQKEEVDEVKWFTRNEVENIIKNDYTAHSITMYFNLLCGLIDEK